MKRRTRTPLAAFLALLSASSLGQQLAPEELPSRGDLGQQLQLQLQEANNSRPRLQLTSDHDFTPRARTFDRRGHLLGRFRQRYKSLRVIGGEMIVHTDREGNVKRTVESVVRNIEVDVTPKISEKEALRIVTEAYLPERWAGGDPTTKAELVIYPAEDRIRLAWLIAIVAGDLDPRRFLVDAHSGEILKRWNDFAEAGYEPAKGTGNTLRYGEVTLNIAKMEGIAKPYRLMDMERGGNVVFNNDDKAASEVLFPAPYDSADTVFGNGEDWKFDGSTTDATGETAAADVAFAIEKTWDLLHNVFGREGLDDEGSPIYARVHYRKTAGERYSDARWSGGFANFGDGATSNANSNTSISVAAHELGHGLWGAATDYDVSTGEAAGLNEGHGDIMGALASIYRADKNGKGSTLPELVPSDRFWSRSVDPAGYEVDGVPGFSYYVDDMDSYEEHVVGCAYGHAFVFLSLGSSPDPASSLYSTFLPGGMRGIGVHKAGQIWYLATTGYLPGTPTFAKMRTAYLNAAEELYGENSFEYKAVQNAFGGISVGSVAFDSQNPNVQLPAPLIREDEGSMWVQTAASDDVGVSRIQLSIDGVVRKTVEQGSAINEHFDISGLDPGLHSVTVKGWDAKGKTDTATRNFTLTGVNDLIRNGRFDGSTGQWTVTGPDPRVDGETAAFLGGGSVRFLSNGSWISQKVTIPASSAKATLGFRLRVNRGLPPQSNEQLRVQLLNNQGGLIDTLDTFSPATNTDSDGSKDYKRYTYDISQQAGRTVEVRFLAPLTLPGRFWLDNVFLVADAPGEFTLSAVVDEGEDSVVVGLDGFKNMTADQIKRVEFTIDNQPAGSLLNKPWQFVREAGSFRRLSPHSVRAIAYDHADKRIGQTETANFTVGPVEQLLRNPGFEQGSLPWIASQGVKFGVNSAEAQQYLSFLGDRFAYIDENSTLDHTLYQVVTLPAGQVTISMSYRVRVDRILNGNDVGGALRLKVLDTSGNVLATLDTVQGDENTHLPLKWRSYVKRTVNLSPWRGQVVRLQFEHRRTSNITKVRFYIDNASVTSKTLGLTGN